MKGKLACLLILIVIIALSLTGCIEINGERGEVRKQVAILEEGLEQNDEGKITSLLYDDFVFYLRDEKFEGEDAVETLLGEAESLALQKAEADIGIVTVNGNSAQAYGAITAKDLVHNIHVYFQKINGEWLIEALEIFIEVEYSGTLEITIENDTTGNYTLTASAETSRIGTNMTRIDALYGGISSGEQWDLALTMHFPDETGEYSWQGGDTEDFYIIIYKLEDDDWNTHRYDTQEDSGSFSIDQNNGILAGTFEGTVFGEEGDLVISGTFYLAE